jgi:hypothetical protein
MTYANQLGTYFYKNASLHTIMAAHTIRVTWSCRGNRDKDDIADFVSAIDESTLIEKTK